MITEADARVLDHGSTIVLVAGGHITPLAQDISASSFASTGFRNGLGGQIRAVERALPRTGGSCPRGCAREGTAINQIATAAPQCRLRSPGMLSPIPNNPTLALATSEPA